MEDQLAPKHFFLGKARLRAASTENTQLEAFISSGFWAGRSCSDIEENGLFFGFSFVVRSAFLPCARRQRMGQFLCQCSAGRRQSRRKLRGRSNLSWC